MQKSLFCLFIFFTSLIAYSQNSDCPKFVSTLPQVEFTSCSHGFETSLLSLEQIREKYPDKLPLMDSDFVAVLSNQYVWTKFQLDLLEGYAASQPLDVLYLHTTGITFLEGYIVDQDGVVREIDFQQFGNTYYASMNQFQSHSNIYIHYRSASELIKNVVVEKKTSFLKKKFAGFLWTSALLGLLFSLFLYNLFLYLKLHYQQYLHYLLFLGINFYLGLVVLNFPFGIVTLGGIEFTEFTLIVRPLALISQVLFLGRFLDWGRYIPRHFLVLKVFISFSYLFALGYLTGLLSYGIANVMLDLYILSYTLISTYLLAYSRWKKIRFSTYLLLAQCSFVGSIFYYLVMTYSEPVVSYTTQVAPLLGIAFESLLMSLALAAKIKEIEKDKDEAKIKSVEMTRLLRVLNHDLRNPLSVIVNANRIIGDLIEKKAFDKVITFQTHIGKASQTMTEISNAIADFEAIRNGNLELTLTRVSTRNLFEEVLQNFEMLCKDKEIELLFHLQEDLYFMADHVVMKNQVLSNLVSNAIKFCHRGGKIELTASSPSEDKVVLVVADCGVGIPKNKISSLFDEYTSTSTKGTAGESGTGFGLPTVYFYVTKVFHGTIDIESQSNEDDFKETGTRISITLGRA